MSDRTEADTVSSDTTLETPSEEANARARAPSKAKVEEPRAL